MQCIECGKTTEGPCPGCGKTMCFECVLRHSCCASCRKRAMPEVEWRAEIRRLGFDVGYTHDKIILRHWDTRADGSHVVVLKDLGLAYRAREVLKELREKYPPR